MTAEWTPLIEFAAHIRLYDIYDGYPFDLDTMIDTWSIVPDHVMVVIDKPDGRHDWALMEPNTSLHDMLEIMV